VKRYAAALCATLLLPLTGCGGQDEQILHVLAAASLTETFTTLAHDFEQQHDGVTVKLVFDSSATLAQQALDGAPGDVLATADETTMASAKDALASDPTVFASNVITLVTPPDNPAGITGLADLARGGVDFVECVDTAPCGKVAAAVLADQGVTAEPASLEVDVKAVLAKVTEGEADAGLVYATDATAAGDQVATVPIDGADAERTTYPIATLDQSDDPDLAKAFVSLVTGATGQKVLADAGFGQP
jgi:molybdate transport system substrate-binding protein